MKTDHPLAQSQRQRQEDTGLAITIITCARPRDCASLLEQVTSAATAMDQLILVDDAALDSALYSGSTRGAQVLRTSGQGAGGARNAALSACEKDWILFLDDDVQLPDGFLAEVRTRLALGTFDVLTANVLSVNSEMGRLFDERYPLSRGPKVATYCGSTGTKWSPNDVWHVGVGACMAWRTSALRETGGFPESLGQGRTFGGAEDLAAFRRALQLGLTIRYDGELVVRHRSPSSMPELRAKMRGYSLALGALAAHVYTQERSFGMAAHVANDIVACPRNLAVEAFRRCTGKPHLPLGPIATFPLLTLRSFVGYLAAPVGTPPQNGTTESK